MYCPSCKTRILKPAKLEYGLPGYTCSVCRGFLIDVLAYRAWAEGKHESHSSKKVVPEKVEDSKSVILCPKCSKIMVKFQISGAAENKLDLCSYCGEIWLDGGEWRLLEQLDLTDKIPQILSEPWQRAIRKEKIEESIDAKFQAIIGVDDFTKVKEFREWMQAHDNHTDILDFLSRPND